MLSPSIYAILKECGRAQTDISEYPAMADPRSGLFGQRAACSGLPFANSGGPFGLSFPKERQSCRFRKYGAGGRGRTDTPFRTGF